MRRRTRPFNSDGAGNGSSPLESSSLPDGLTEGARDSDGVFELEPRLGGAETDYHWASREAEGVVINEKAGGHPPIPAGERRIASLNDSFNRSLLDDTLKLRTYPRRHPLDLD